MGKCVNQWTLLQTFMVPSVVCMKWLNPLSWEINNTDKLSWDFWQSKVSVNGTTISSSLQNKSQILSLARCGIVSLITRRNMVWDLTQKNLTSALISISACDMVMLHRL
eukprot:TRINITY_DN10479_c0_g1_i1.p1 TRINITY_DN10479_c0_g1~~TRINITY_DN10479_c0_g1_i1.p1  ORF type:complete len:109 (-),score=15.47 TRINITY_DN10479_c0_g1_i1:121-447(-)